MELSNDEKCTVLAVFDSLMRMPTDDLHKFLGSYTIQAMQNLYQKMRYEDYCKSRGIAYEDMTEEDFIDAYLQESEG